MTGNRRTTELVSSEAKSLLVGFLGGYQDILLSRIDANQAVCKQNELIDEYTRRIVDELGSGTCKMLPPTIDRTCVVRDNPTGITMEFGFWCCSNCGCNNFYGAKHCQECGAKAVE